MEQGYIKLYREIMEDEFYFSERFTKSAAWIDLLLLAQHSEKPSVVDIRGNLVEVKRGMLCRSQLTLAKRWKWNIRTVANYLSLLSRRQKVHYRKSHITTVITIVNYDQYQRSALQSALQSGNRVHTDKNVKNEKNVFVAELVTHLNNNDIVFSEKRLAARMDKALGDYSPDCVRGAVNDAVAGWNRNGNSGDFISYLFTTLNRNYERMNNGQR